MFAPADRDKNILSKSDFLEYATKEENDAFVFAVAGLVCRIPRSTFKHPGGDKVIQDIHGRDATEHIEAAHRTDKHVYARLKAACVGKLVEKDCLVPQIDRELRQLKRVFENEGLFDLSNTKGWFRTIEPLLLICGSVYYLQLCQPGWISFLIVSMVGALGYLRLLWWMHDATHHALFPDGRTTQMALDVGSFVAFGCYVRQAFREHGIHHAFTNVMDHDWNEEFLHIFEVAPEHAGRFPKWLRGDGIGQCIVWYGLALPAFGILKYIGALQESYARGWWWRPLLMISRMVFVIRFGLTWTMLVLPLVALFVIAFVGVLNHLHMPMVNSASGDHNQNSFDPRKAWGPTKNETTGNKVEDDIRRSWTYAMVAPTSSVAPGSTVYGYVSGGLNYHVEHHLFPCMVSTNLHKSSDRVKALIDKHGLPYATDSFMGALSNTAMQMFDPSRVAESPTPKNCNNVRPENCYPRRSGKKQIVGTMN